MSKKPLTVGSLRPETKESQPPKGNKPSPPQQAKQMPGSPPLIKIMQHNRLFSLTPSSGKTMLDTALSQNLPVDYKCRKGDCGKCKVKVIEGSEWLSPPTEKEMSKLKNELAEGYRFACQTIIN